VCIHQGNAYNVVMLLIIEIVYLQISVPLVSAYISRDIFPWYNRLPDSAADIHRAWSHPTSVP